MEHGTFWIPTFHLVILPSSIHVGLIRSFSAVFTKSRHGILSCLMDSSSDLQTVFLSSVLRCRPIQAHVSEAVFPRARCVYLPIPSSLILSLNQYLLKTTNQNYPLDITQWVHYTKSPAGCCIRLIFKHISLTTMIIRLVTDFQGSFKQDKTTWLSIPATEWLIKTIRRKENEILDVMDERASYLS